MSDLSCPKCKAELEPDEKKSGKCGVCGHKINVPKVRLDAPPKLAMVSTPAGTCPLKPKSHLPVDIAKWCDAMIEHGIKEKKMYTTNALKYFLNSLFEGNQLKYARDNVDAWDVCDLDAEDFNLQPTDEDLFSEENYQEDKGEDTDLSIGEEDNYICVSPYCMHAEWYTQDEYDEEPNCPDCGEPLELSQESPNYNDGEMRSDDSLSRYDTDYDAYHGQDYGQSHLRQPYVRSDGVKIYGNTSYRSKPEPPPPVTDIQERYRQPRSEEDEELLAKAVERGNEIIGVITDDDVIKTWSP